MFISFLNIEIDKIELKVTMLHEVLFLASAFQDFSKYFLYLPIPELRLPKYLIYPWNHKQQPEKF